MSDQVQCPNCGGFRVYSEKDNTLEERIAPAKELLRNSFVIPSVIAVPSIIVSVISVYYPSDLTTGLGVLGIAASVILFVVLFLWYLWVLVFGNGEFRYQTRTGIYHKYSCNLCGYKWEWLPGKPLPRVHINPDLITKGEQRLAREEEERRRQAALEFGSFRKGVDKAKKTR